MHILFFYLISLFFAFLKACFLEQSCLTGTFWQNLIYPWN
jgi:hypothetical protein